MRNSKTYVSGIASIWLAAAAVHAQSLTPEEQAMLERMMRSSGMDPEQIRQMQQMQASQANAQRWGDVVHYRLIGVYRAQANVSSDANWGAHVDAVDRIEMTFDWQLTEGKVIGTPVIHNFKTTIANPRNPEKKCAPPTVNGPYEHAELKQVEAAYGTSVHLHMQRSYPPVAVAQFCTGTRKNIPAVQRMDVYELPVASPALLSMPLTDATMVKPSADGKSLIFEKGGWTWTFTPSP